MPRFIADEPVQRRAQDSGPMRTFVVYETVPHWVRHAYKVQARDAEGALAAYSAGKYEDHGRPVIADVIESSDAPTRAAEEYKGAQLEHAALAVLYNGKRTQLNRREYQILSALWQEFGQFVTVASLVDLLETTGVSGSMESLRVLLCHLRARIDGLPLIIDNELGKGYRLREACPACAK